VMVDYNGAVKVLDFGVARVATSFRRSITEPGHLKGKSAYIAPEQLSGTFDHRADIFSTGILLHEMLSGRRLFKAQSALENMKLVQAMVIPPPSQLNPDVPPALDAIVLRALERNPASRFQTASALGEALAQFLLESRAPSQELPQFMQTVFEVERREDERALAREAMERRSATPPAAALAVPVLTGTADVVAPPSLVAAWPELDSDEVAEPRGMDARRKRRLIAAASAVLGAALVLGLLLTRRRAPVAAITPPAPPPAKVAAPPAAPEVLPAEPVAEAHPAEPAAPATVQISVSSEPSGAVVERVGERSRLGVTPLVVSAARGEEPLVFRISKPGYVEGLLRLVPDGSKSGLVTLARRTSRKGSSRGPKPRKVIDAVPSDPFSE
jgi:hypothetical protein